MRNAEKFYITEEEKDTYISALIPELSVLRAKAEISQEELANAIGVSRQTYIAIERRAKKMSWATYIALVFFYASNSRTKELIRTISYPYDVLRRFNGHDEAPDYALDDFLDNSESFVIDKLDEQALRSIRTIIMVEYARCASK